MPAWKNPLTRSLKEWEGWQHAAGLLRWFRGYSPFPVAVMFHLTFRCNLQCPVCLQTLQRADLLAMSHDELTLAEWQAVVDNLRRSFPLRPFIHLTGGEPTLYKDFLPLVVYVKEKGFRCSLTTNGVLLERHAARLVALGVDRVHVSLDGPAALHDALRGLPGTFERAVAGVQALRAAREAQGQKKPLVTINCVISDANQEQLGDLIPIARQAGADSLSYQHLIFSDCSTRRPHNINLERLAATIPHLQTAAAAQGVAVTFFPKIPAQRLRDYYLGPEEALGGECLFPWLVIRVAPHGVITPCRGLVVGDVRHQTESWAALWNGPTLRAFRRELARQHVFPDCGRCCHRQYT